jgi:hypothetical protein
MLKKWIFSLVLMGLAPALAAEPADDESTLKLPARSLESRPNFIRFSVGDAPYALVRATEEDGRGFKLKDARKSPAEREKFANQFAIQNSLNTLIVYKMGSRHNEFRNYLFGLYSIFALSPDATGTFVGELILDEFELSSDGCVEISIDVDPAFRKKGIAFASTKAALSGIIDPNLGKKSLVFDNRAVQSKIAKTFQRAFLPSEKPLTMLKSKVAFDNFPSLLLNRKLPFSLWNFAVDYSLVYAYPPRESDVQPAAIPYVKMLFNSNEAERQEGIRVLRNSIDEMRRQ